MRNIIISLIIIILIIIILIIYFDTPNDEEILIQCSTEQTYAHNILLDSLLYLKKEPFILTANQSIIEYSPEALKGFTTSIANVTASNYFNGQLNGPINQFKFNGGNFHRANILYTPYMKGYVKTGTHGDVISFLPIVNIKTNKRVNSYMYTQTFGGYASDNSYKSCYNAFKLVSDQYLNDNIPFIIMGDFNVAGWGDVSDFIFGNSVYHNDKLLITCNDNEGIATPDGIIIHTSLAKGVTYGICNQHIKNRQHYSLYAKLHKYKSGIHIDDLAKTITKWLLNNYGNRDNFFKYSGFSPEKHASTETMTDLDISLETLSSYDIYKKVSALNEYAQIF